MILLDSDVWVAFFNTNDSQHARAQKLLAALATQRADVGVHEYVVLEVVTVLRRVAGPQQASAFVESIARLGGLRVLYSSAETVRDICAATYQQCHPKLSFTDLVLLSYAKTHTIHTFDKALQRAIRT